jgi:hypothetical protein
MESRLTIEEASKQAKERRKEWSEINPIIQYGFFALLILLIIGTAYISLQSSLIQRLDILQKLFLVVSTFLVIYVLFLNVDFNTRTEEARTRENDLKLSEVLYTKIIREMLEYFPESIFIYNEIAPFDPRSTEELEKVVKYDPLKRKAVEEYFANVLIGNFENLMTMNKYIVGADMGWWLTYYYIFQSAIIQRVWKNVYIFFPPEMIYLVNNFIEIGKDPNLTVEDIESRIKKLYVN